MSDLERVTDDVAELKLFRAVKQYHDSVNTNTSEVMYNAACGRLRDRGIDPLNPIHEENPRAKAAFDAFFEDSMAVFDKVSARPGGVS